MVRNGVAAAVAVLTIASCASARDATVPAYLGDYDLLAADVSLSPDGIGNTVVGSTRLRMRVLRAGMQELRLDANALAISSATANGARIETRMADDHLVVTLSRAYRRGELLDLRFAYSGTPTRGLVLAENSAFTSYFTCDWMICALDRPGDKAAFTLELAARSVQRLPSDCALSHRPVSHRRLTCAPITNDVASRSGTAPGSVHAQSHYKSSRSTRGPNVQDRGIRLPGTDVVCLCSRIDGCATRCPFGWPVDSCAWILARLDRAGDAGCRGDKRVRDTRDVAVVAAFLPGRRRGHLRRWIFHRRHRRPLSPLEWFTASTLNS